jgi:hypothetical protein
MWCMSLFRVKSGLAKSLLGSVLDFQRIEVDMGTVEGIPKIAEDTLKTVEDTLTIAEDIQKIAVGIQKVAVGIRNLAGGEEPRTVTETCTLSGGSSGGNLQSKDHTLQLDGWNCIVRGLVSMGWVKGFPR